MIRLLGSQTSRPDETKIDNWSLIEGYEFGGFAKSTELLTQFVNRFTKETQINLEPVYSGKSFYATFDLIAKGYFPDSAKVLLIHCGGLQGVKPLPLEGEG